MAKETKQHILKGFSELLIDYDFDKITVTMLVEKCNISRQTFYYHFADIQSLIDWGVKQYTQGCVETAKNARDMKDATVIYLKEIERNKVFLKKVFASSLSQYMTKLIRDSIIEYSSEFYNQAVRHGYARSDTAEMIIEFTANGVTGFIVTHILEDSNMNIDELAEKMNHSIFLRLAGRNLLDHQM